jgi:eukaryotic-like serine/threonine-protein kinase
MDKELTLVRSVDEDARRRFESARRSGRCAPIEQFLPPEDDPRYLATAEELVHIELELEWKSRRAPPDGVGTDGHHPSFVESYLARLPLLNQPEIVLRLLQQEFLVRRLHGDRPTGEDYRRRFPEVVVTGREVEEALPSIEPRAPRDVIAEPPPGARLGQYRLCAEYARGGFGLVWRADDEILGREVALKQMSGDLAADADYRQRFVAEARIAARLQHPGVVPVYNLGEAEGQHPYYAMKLVRGQTMAEAIRRFHSEPRETGERTVEHLRLLNAYLAVTRAMAYSHSRGVIHRDLKPDNIVLGDYGETVILDWGLAKVLRDGAAEEESPAVPAASPSPVNATQFGTVMGTPAYMSPEQAAGRLSEVDERSDIYCLGAILYHLLTGQPPFRGTDSDDVVQQVLAQAPPRPSTVSTTVPRALEAICLRAMASKRSERYAEVVALSRDLERYLADEPVSAHREGVLERLGRWARHHRTVVATGSMTVFLVTLGALGGLLLWQRDVERRRIEREELMRSAQDTETAGLDELRAGRFVSAEKLFRQALEPLEAKPELEGLGARLERRRDQAHRLVEFNRRADDAERLAFLEYDDEAIDAAESALEQLRVFEHQKEWMAHLPASDLAWAQREQLQKDAYRTLLYLAGMRAKRGLIDANDPAAKSGYSSAIEAAALAQHFQKAQSAGLIELLCRLRLGQPFQLPPRRDSTNAADVYFMGMLHFWIAQVPPDEPIRRVAAQGLLLGTVIGLDFNTPMATADELLRSAADLQPQHYWTHLWRGWRYAVDQNPLAAELCFSTCVVLRPNYALGYAERGQAIIQQIKKADSLERKRDLERRGRQDFSQAIAHEPAEPWIRWLQAMSLEALGRNQEALQAYATAIELERPLKTWRGRRIEGEKKSILKLAAQMADKVIGAEPKNAEAYAVRGLAHLSLEKDQQAFDDATAALRLDGHNVRALTVRGLVHVHRQHPAQALADLSAVLASAPDNYLAATGCVQARQMQHHDEDALAALDRVLKISVADWQRLEANQERVRALHRLSRQSEAVVALEAVRQLDPKRARALASELSIGTR